MRESITYALKAALVILTVVAAISSVVLYVQSSSHENPALFDTDGDGFIDGDEMVWWTSWLDRNDNPMTTRILPVAMAAVAVAAALIIAKIRSRRTIPDLVPALLKKARAMKDAVSSGNRRGIESSKADFDAAIADIRAGSHREALREPGIQDILVEFEVLCLDASVDGGKLDPEDRNVSNPPANRK